MTQALYRKQTAMTASQPAETNAIIHWQAKSSAEKWRICRLFMLKQKLSYWLSSYRSWDYLQFGNRSNFCWSQKLFYCSSSLSLMRIFISSLKKSAAAAELMLCYAGWVGGGGGRGVTIFHEFRRSTYTLWYSSCYLAEKKIFFINNLRCAATFLFSRLLVSVKVKYSSVSFLC